MAPTRVFEADAGGMVRAIASGFVELPRGASRPATALNDHKNAGDRGGIAVPTSSIESRWLVSPVMSGPETAP